MSYTARVRVRLNRKPWYYGTPVWEVTCPCCSNPSTQVGAFTVAGGWPEAITRANLHASKHWWRQ